MILLVKSQYETLYDKCKEYGVNWIVEISGLALNVWLQYCKQGVTLGHWLRIHLDLVSIWCKERGESYTTGNTLLALVTRSQGPSFYFFSSVKKWATNHKIILTAWSTYLFLVMQISITDGWNICNTCFVCIMILFRRQTGLLCVAGRVLFTDASYELRTLKSFVITDSSTCTCQYFF